MDTIEPSTHRVAIYARVSTRDKDQDPELQLGPLREYVATRGWVAVEYVDFAPAGDLRHRTSWRRLLDDGHANLPVGGHGLPRWRTADLHVGGQLISTPASDPAIAIPPDR